MPEDLEPIDALPEKEPEQIIDVSRTAVIESCFWPSLPVYDADHEAYGQHGIGQWMTTIDIGVVEMNEWPDIDPRYIEQWPILETWKATGAESFGAVRFHKYIEMADPSIEARLFLVQYPSSHRIGLEVRHERFGVAVCDDIGVSATCNEGELNAAFSAHIVGLTTDVRRQYQEWRNRLADKINEAKREWYELNAGDVSDETAS